MSEPIIINPSMIQVAIDVSDASVPTALRELADWIESHCVACRAAEGTTMSHVDPCDHKPTGRYMEGQPVCRCVWEGHALAVAQEELRDLRVQLKQRYAEAVAHKLSSDKRIRERSFRATWSQNKIERQRIALVAAEERRLEMRAQLRRQSKKIASLVENLS